MMLRGLLGFAVVVTVLCHASAQTLTNIVPDGKPHKFEARDRNFWIDGEPTMLLAGEMHFGRVVGESWEHRIRQARAMGLNAVSFYLFWNQVEPREGEYAFTGSNDVRRVIQLCQENGMWVILRPGPYCCAETEFGGIPWWLLKDRDMRVRSNDPKFLAHVRRYINKLAEEVADLQISRGGPIVMMQLDNEYGRADDYMRSLKTIFTEAGFDAQLFTCDHSRAATWRGTDLIPGVIPCRNGLRSEQMFNQSAAAIGDYPVFTPEVYTAWYSIWGGEIAKKSIEEQLQWTNWLIDRNYSFSLYVFHGGTNFGFTNGSNQWRPVQTSYNYDAPVDEAGRATPKYHALRELLGKRFTRELPPAPENPKMIEIAPVELSQRMPMLDLLPAEPTITSGETVSMEDIEQGYGFILYRKRFEDGLKGTIELRRALDYAVVLINGQPVGRSFAGFGPGSSRIAVESSGPTTLDILVYNLGRTSSPFNQGTSRKGLIDGAYLDGTKLTNWHIYSMPMDRIDGFKPSEKPHAGPTLYRGTFELSETGETFLDMRNWGFGVVYVNGHNLGRFWDRGGLRSLYLPGTWQKIGTNEIVILELQDAPAVAQVSGVTHIIEEPAKSFGFEQRGRTTSPAN